MAKQFILLPYNWNLSKCLSAILAYTRGVFTMMMSRYLKW